MGNETWYINIVFIVYYFYCSVLGALTSVFGQLMTAVGSSDRLFEILDLEPEINSYPNSGGRIPNIINKASGIVVEEKDHKEENLLINPITLIVVVMKKQSKEK